MLSFLSSFSLATKLKALAVGVGILAATHSGAYLAGYLVGRAKQEAKQSTVTITDTINRFQNGEKSRDAYEKMSPSQRCHSMPLAGGLRNPECD